MHKSTRFVSKNSTLYKQNTFLWYNITTIKGGFIIMKDIGNIIKQKRKLKKLTLEDVAKHLNVSTSTVSKWENNHISNLKREKLIALCNFLDLSPLQFINTMEVDYKISIEGFKTQLNFIMIHTPELSEKERNLIKDYVDLIISNKGE